MNPFQNKYFSIGAKALVTLFAILITQAITSAACAQNMRTSRIDTTENRQDPPPTVKELEVADPVNSRSGMMTFIRPLDSDFIFKQGPDVSGLQEFSATDRYNASVEIIGSENDIQIVKWTINFNTDRDVNIKEVFRLANFLNGIAGQEAVQWLSDQHKNNLATHPMNDYTETKQFGSRKIKFEYFPKLRYTSMTIFMKK